MYHQQVYDCPISQTSLKPIQAILILDADGKRICAKYYNSHYATEKKQLEFEKKLYIKTKNSNSRTDGLHIYLVVLLELVLFRLCACVRARVCVRACVCVCLRHCRWRYCLL